LISFCGGCVAFISTYDHHYHAFCPGCRGPASNIGVTSKEPSGRSMASRRVEGYVKMRSPVLLKHLCDLRMGSLSQSIFVSNVHVGQVALCVVCSYL
jgi:hypothetical protein